MCLQLAGIIHHHGEAPSRSRNVPKATGDRHWTSLRKVYVEKSILFFRFAAPVLFQSLPHFGGILFLSPSFRYKNTGAIERCDGIFLTPNVCKPFQTKIGDGICVVCSSFVNPSVLVHTCDECNYGSLAGRCVICGNPGVTDAFYCRECCQLGKNAEGCPKIVNLGATKTDLFYERKKYGFKKR